MLLDDIQIGAVSQAIEVEIRPTGQAGRQAREHIVLIDIQLVYDPVEIDIADAGWLRCEKRRRAQYSVRRSSSAEPWLEDSRLSASRKLSLSSFGIGACSLISENWVSVVLAQALVLAS